MWCLFRHLIFPSIFFPTSHNGKTIFNEFFTFSPKANKKPMETSFPIECKMMWWMHVVVSIVVQPNHFLPFYRCKCVFPEMSTNCDNDDVDDVDKFVPSLLFSTFFFCFLSCRTCEFDEQTFRFNVRVLRMSVCKCMRAHSLPIVLTQTVSVDGKTGRKWKI